MCRFARSNGLGSRVQTYRPARHVFRCALVTIARNYNTASQRSEMPTIGGLHLAIGTEFQSTCDAVSYPQVTAHSGARLFMSSPSAKSGGIWQRWNALPLYLRILLAMVVGAVTGLV